MTPLPVTTILEALSYRARLMPEALAYAFESSSLTYGQLQVDATKVACGLIQRGGKSSDRYAVLLPTSLDYVRAFFGAQAAGALPMAINPELPVPFLISRMEAVQCRAAIVPRARLAAFPQHESLRFYAVEDLLQSPATSITDTPGPNDGALLCATSGTSGEHRTALILHRNVIASVRGSAERLAIRPEDVLVNWVPLYHSLGLMRLLMGGPYFGCPVHLVSPGLLNLRRWLETIARVRATVTAAPDFGYRVATELVKPDGLDLSSLRYALNSGEPIRPSTLEHFEHKFGVPGVIRPGYGLSEANGVCNMGAGESLRVDANGILSCGRAADGLQLEIVDDAGLPQTPGTIGEIRISGEQVFAGYCDDEAATRERLRNGWFYTGDIGQLDADGHLFIQGRKRALIKRAGTLIVPRDVEEPAEQVKGVLAAGAIGVDRSSLGIEDLVVVIEVEPEHASSDEDDQRIMQHVSAAIAEARGLTPNAIVIVGPGMIPRTPNGKLRHEELKRLFLADQLRRN